MIGKIPPLHITQHKRFVPYGTHSNFRFAKTSFMLGPLCDSPKRKKVLEEIMGSDKRINPCK